MNIRIAIGPNPNNPICEFFTKDIYTLSNITAVDIVGTELSIDQLTPQVYYPYGDDVVELTAPSDYDKVITSDGFVLATNRKFTNPRSLTYGTVVWYFLDNVLIAKMYLKSVYRISQYVYKINAMSVIGLLETQKHYGNVYRGVSFEDIAREIIGDAVDFTVADDVKHLQIYGWLPYANKRANLHQLAFSSGVMCAKDENGDLLFRFITNENSKVIPKSRIYYGGKVDYPAFASAVDVTEHSFFSLPTDQVVTVYDNTDGSETADHTFIAFRDAPLHDLETTGTLVIEDSGVNWAIVTGTGALTGKKYTHSTRVLHLAAENAGDQRENVATVSDAYLVNVTNSDNVARRVLAYYNSRKVVTASIVEQGEKCGDLITGFDPYNEPISGFIASMRSNISGIVKADCEIITDYVPTGQGSNYTKYVVLTGSGVWDIPAEVFEKEHPTIQATLISGGHGGYKGSPGKTDSSAWTTVVGPATDGGDGGDPGPGGRVVVVTIDCNGKVSIPYDCGAGGESDSDGEDTTFDAYSSSAGIPSVYGVANIFTGEVYGTVGAEKGVAGGRGSGGSSIGTTVTYKGNSWGPGANNTSRVTNGDMYANGGYGGGAAVGSNGSAGNNGSIVLQPNGSYFTTGGRGGAGANGGAGNDSAILGGGGNGGHGGGGGGQGGSCRGESTNYQMQGSSGTPGQGGPGGRGGDGVIVIYY